MSVTKYSTKRRVPNDFITEAEWQRAKVLGNIGTERLVGIISSPNFGKLPIRDQLLAIKMATDLAYKPMVTPPEAAPVTINIDGSQSANAMRELANQAILPEMRPKVN